MLNFGTKLNLFCIRADDFWMEDDTAKIKSINFSQILLADPGPSLLHRCAAKIFPCRCSEISTFTILTLPYGKERIGIPLWLLLSAREFGKVDVAAKLSWGVNI